MRTSTDNREPTDLVDAAAEAMRAGEPIVIHDQRICAVAVAAELVDPEVITHLALNARGMISVAMAAARLDALQIPQMATSDSRRPGHAVTVDAVVGTTTGISAHDRSATVRALLAREPDGRIVAPGHVSPIRAADGGILERAGIPEAAVAIAESAGLEPVVCLCEILADDGSALPPSELASHPDFAASIALSPMLAQAHSRGLAESAVVGSGGFAAAMSMLASGVAAITTRDREGEPRGMLATAVTSYSDSPPSLLISAAHSSRTHDPLVDSVGIGVHLLADDQQREASLLAGKADDKFRDLQWRWDGDVPRVDGSLAYLRCRRVDCFARYDHTIVIADVETAEIGDALPLLYFQRSLDWHLRHPGLERPSHGRQPTPRAS